MSRTVAQFEAMLGRFGESIRDLQPELQELADQIVTDLKAGIRAEGLVKTTALVDSVRAQVTSNTLEISMKDYGMYNNYGVKGLDGVKNGVVREVEANVNPQPRLGLYYQYRKREFGIPSRQFFTMTGLRSQLVEEITTTITGTFN